MGNPTRSIVLDQVQGVSGNGKGAPPVDRRGTFAALVLLACFGLWSACSRAAVPGSDLPWTLNPTGYLTTTWYIGLYLSSIAAKEVMNSGLTFVLERLCGFKHMDEGDVKVRKLEVLESLDLCYLAISTVSEFLGMNHVAAFVLQGPVETRLASFTMLNGPLAFFVILTLNDILYYPFHLIAHCRSFYPYCHKQHHRQFLPFRGYKDAANLHPLEELCGWSIFFLSMFITSKVTGLHQGAALLGFFAWSFFNLLNHFDFDSTLHLPVPYPAFARDHQMHHRLSQGNYSTLTTMCDRLCGTYLPYRQLGKRAGRGAQQPHESRGAEALPSPWSVGGCGAALCFLVLAGECAHAGGLPPLPVLGGAFVQPLAAIATCTLVTAAARHVVTAPKVSSKNHRSASQVQ